MDLRFLRDVDKREVDFLVLKDGRPEFAVECKTGERAVNPRALLFPRPDFDPAAVSSAFREPGL
jgi:hypothetical protein